MNSPISNVKKEKKKNYNFARLRLNYYYDYLCHTHLLGEVLQLLTIMCHTRILLLCVIYYITIKMYIEVLCIVILWFLE